MFLIRAAFWLALVIMLIPGDPQSGAEAPRVSAMQAFFAAKATVADMSGFCDRNPDVCDTGGAAIKVFADRARNGAQKLYEYFDEAPAGTDQAPAAAEPNRGTLNNDDLEPSWRGSVAPESAA